MRTGNAVGGGTAGVRTIRELQQLTDFLNTESQFPRMPDKFEAPHILRPIETVPAFGAGEWPDETDVYRNSEWFVPWLKRSQQVYQLPFRTWRFLLKLWWLEIVSKAPKYSKRLVVGVAGLKVGNTEA